MTSPDIVSLKEIAERLGVAPSTPSQWRKRGLMPDPDWVLAIGPVWEWSHIELWAMDTGRLNDWSPS